jgi:hypothetical protein
VPAIVVRAPGYRPLSVLDAGCGEGWWSAALMALSSQVGHVMSVDQAVPDEVAPGVEVVVCDLGQPGSIGGGPYDLGICLEVAEHLSVAGGINLVASLTRAVHGVIAWSAAIPGQRGHGHLNEQWPAYWDAEFKRYGWSLTDPFREAWWDDERVDASYRQNLLLAVPGRCPPIAPRALVHPIFYNRERGEC